MRCLDGLADSVDISLNKFWERVKDSKAWYAAAHEVTKNQTQLSLTNSNSSTTLSTVG